MLDLWLALGIPVVAFALGYLLAMPAKAPGTLRCRAFGHKFIAKRRTEENGYVIRTKHAIDYCIRCGDARPASPSSRLPQSPEPNKDTA